jgi:hypothetical protein
MNAHTHTLDVGAQRGGFDGGPCLDIKAVGQRKFLKFASDGLGAKRIVNTLNRQIYV